MKIVIAGGTGLIGTQVEKYLLDKGHDVHILTRSPKATNHVQWDPAKEVIDLERIADSELIINLCGSGIADSRWTEARKKELEISRIEPAEFLAKLVPEMKNLESYISASGITCFGFDDIGRPYTEEDPYGKDYTSQLVKRWEKTLDAFPPHIRTVALRFGIVLSGKGGAIPRIAKPIKMGVGAAIGSGDQVVQWLDISEIPKVIDHVQANKLSGTFNVLQGNTTNAELTKSIAKSLDKWVLPINVPSFLMKALYGEMSVLLLEGVKASNEKLTATGYQFKTDSLDEVMNSLQL